MRTTHIASILYHQLLPNSTQTICSQKNTWTRIDSLNKTSNLEWNDSFRTCFVDCYIYHYVRMKFIQIPFIFYQLFSKSIYTSRGDITIFHFNRLNLRYQTMIQKWLAYYHCHAGCKLMDEEKLKQNWYTKLIMNFSRTSVYVTIHWSV